MNKQPNNIVSIREPPAEYTTVEDFDVLVDEYKQAISLGESYSWKMADIALEASWHNKQGGLKGFAEKTGDSYNTLKRYSSIAAAYSEGNRLPNLSFKHHFVIYSHPDREALLQRAVNEKLSAAKLRSIAYPPKPKLITIVTNSMAAESLLTDGISLVKESVPSQSPEDKKSFSEIIDAINWYVLHDKEKYDMAQMAPLPYFISLLFGDDHKIIQIADGTWTLGDKIPS